MKSILATTFGLVGLINALPAPGVDRVLPLNWKYSITSLRGPGCPDFGKDPEKQRTTRLTYGQNTMDGSEIYYWFVAYPNLRVNLEDEDRSWCETELSYQEYKDLDGKVPTADYRLRLHKNGTRVIATYDLEEGVKATFKFTYDTGDDEVCPLLPTSVFHFSSSFYFGWLILANTSFNRSSTLLHGKDPWLRVNTNKRPALRYPKSLRYTSCPSVVPERSSSEQISPLRVRRAKRALWRVSTPKTHKELSSTMGCNRDSAMIGRDARSR
jgi:hypothetical protein